MVFHGKRTELLILRALAFLVERWILAHGDQGGSKGRILSNELTTEADRVSDAMRAEKEFESKEAKRKS